MLAHGTTITEAAVASRGVHFALTRADEDRVLTAADDEALMEVVEDIEERWERGFVAETDKAWDAIHRCLTGGALAFDGGTYPLNRAVLGGRQLYDGDDYIVCYVPADEVRDVAAALEPLGEAWLRSRYFALDPGDYGAEHSDEDFEYTWDNFIGMRDFFVEAAGRGRAVLFTVDQ